MFTTSGGLAGLLVTGAMPNFSRTHPLSAGDSSFRKIPRYFTAGSPSTYRPAFTNRASLWTAGTSAQKYQGETPICSETS